MRKCLSSEAAQILSCGRPAHPLRRPLRALVCHHNRALGGVKSPFEMMRLLIKRLDTACSASARDET
jgi:hypothetical protein